MTDLTERERQIVAWLRGSADDLDSAAAHFTLSATAGVRLAAADRRCVAKAIERGQPWGEQA